MRTHGCLATFGGLSLAIGCNAIFGVEDPVVVESQASGGAGGEGAAAATGGGPSVSPILPTPGAAGGAGGAPFAPEGGDGGRSEIAEAGGGSGGKVEPGPETGGSAPAQGGTQSTGGVADAGSEDSQAGAAGAAGSSGCADGESHCAPDNVTLETCDGGTLLSTDCKNGCIRGACAECIPRTVECRTGDNSVRVCGDDGRFDDFEECDDGKTCLPGEGCGGKCGPDQVRCNTGDAEACDRGEWSRVATCISNDQLCVIESGVSKCIENKVRPLGPEVPLTNGSLRSVTPDVLHIYPAPLVDVKAFAIQLGLIGAGYARLVLYADDGNGYPGARLRSTDVLNLVAGEANAKDLLGAALLLDPDLRYWIGVVFANSGSPQLYCRMNQPQAPGGYLVYQPYDDGFPDTFPAGALPDADTECNLFLRVRTQTP